MALGECRECSDQVSTEAEFCPNCGVPDPTDPEGGSSEDEETGCAGCLAVLGLLFVIAVTIMLALTSSDSDSTSDRTQFEPSTGSSTAECLSVPSERIDAIESGLRQGRLSGGQAVRSDAHENLYYIATRFYGPGADGEPLIFATNNLNGSGGLVLAVDEVAAEITDWPHGASTDARTAYSDEGAQAAEDCLE